MTINDRFFSLLKERGITQKEFALNTGISEKTISGWKIRKTDPPASSLSSIADFFDVSVDYLVTGKEYTPQNCAYKDGVTNRSVGSHTKNQYGITSNQTDELTTELLNLYSQLTPLEQKMILGKIAEIIYNKSNTK